MFFALRTHVFAQQYNFCEWKHSYPASFAAVVPPKLKPWLSRALSLRAQRIGLLSLLDWLGMIPFLLSPNPCKKRLSRRWSENVSLAYMTRPQMEPRPTTAAFPWTIWDTVRSYDYEGGNSSLDGWYKPCVLCIQEQFWGALTWVEYSAPS